MPFAGYSGAFTAESSGAFSMVRSQSWRSLRCAVYMQTSTWAHDSRQGICSAGQDICVTGRSLWCAARYKMSSVAHSHSISLLHGPRRKLRHEVQPRLRRRPWYVVPPFSTAKRLPYVSHNRTSSATHGCKTVYPVVSIATHSSVAALFTTTKTPPTRSQRDAEAVG